MNSVVCEQDKNLNVAQSYYHSILKKDFDAVSECLDSNVHFISPLSEFSGKGAVVEAVKKLSLVLVDIQIRAQFASGNSIMFAYDFIFSEPIGALRSAVLMEFTDQRISKIELFYDGRPFEKSKSEIFSQR